MIDNKAHQQILQDLELRYKLPNSYNIYQAKVALVAKVVKYYTWEKLDLTSFTADVWTNQCTNSLLSRTAHWIDGDFNRHFAMSHASVIQVWFRSRCMIMHQQWLRKRVMLTFHHSAVSHKHCNLVWTNLSRCYFDENAENLIYNVDSNMF